MIGSTSTTGAGPIEQVGGDLHLLGQGEMASDHQIHLAEGGVGLDVGQHPAKHARLGHVGGRAQSRAAAKEHRGRQHRVDPVGGQDILLRAAADTRGRNEGGKDQRHRHGAILTTYGSIPVVVWLKWAGLRDTDVGGLLVAHAGELSAKLFQVQHGDLFIKMLW
jgi:hypothetical protein